MKLTTQQTERAAGVLLGSAAGDALGAGYEFTHPAAGTVVDMIGGGPFDWAPGEWTDDTSMAMAIALAAVDGADIARGAGLDAVARNFAAWYDTHPAHIGNQTRAVLSNRDTAAAAMTAHAAAMTGRKGGNGSLMRTAPVALATLGSYSECLSAAAAVSRLTHDDQRATEACQMWSYAIRYAVRHGNFGGVRRFLRYASSDVAGYWGPLLDAAETGEPADFANNGWVVHALQTAWWAIRRTESAGPQQLRDALELCVLAGGDTDTTAAIAGGLLGARWGVSAIPAAWRRVVHGYPHLRADDLVRIAVRIATSGHDDAQGWPSAPVLDYSRFTTQRIAEHPHDSGVSLSGADHLTDSGFDAVVSLCRVGSKPIAAEHISFWLIDAGYGPNPNLDFVLDDAARTIRQLRSEGKRVLVHCVEGKSRTPSVAAKYSMLLGRSPSDVLGAMPWARPNHELWAAAIAPAAGTESV